MATESIRDESEPVIPVPILAPAPHRTACWPRVLLLTVGLAGLWLAQGIAGWSSGPPDGGVQLVTAAVVIASLIVIGLTISRILTMAESRWRSVFRSGRILACAAFLSAVTVMLVGSLFVLLDPFHDVVTRGHIGAADIADAGWLFAAVVCCVGAVTALLGGWDASREERHWADSLRIGH